MAIENSFYIENIMNIFLTGCTSYIGRYLAISFINQGDYVIGTSRKNPNIKNKKFRFIKHDLSKSPILNLNKKIDFFIHVAGKRMSKGQKLKNILVVILLLLIM